MEIKKILCLANSRKNHNYCIAGKIILNNHQNKWIRPISSSQTGELSSSDIKLTNRKIPKLGDVIEIKIKEQCPNGHQIENYLNDSTFQWKYCKTVSNSHLEKFLDAPKQLWINGSNSNDGKNDRVSKDKINQCKSSLYFIKASDARIILSKYGTKKRVRINFKYNDDSYSISVTDISIEKKYEEKSTDNYKIGNCFLTISLASVFQEYYYKLAAGVIPLK